MADDGDLEWTLSEEERTFLGQAVVPIHAALVAKDQSVGEAFLTLFDGLQSQAAGGGTLRLSRAQQHMMRDLVPDLARLYGPAMGSVAVDVSKALERVSKTQFIFPAGIPSGEVFGEARVFLRHAGDDQENLTDEVWVELNPASSFTVPDPTVLLYLAAILCGVGAMTAYDLGRDRLEQMLMILGFMFTVAGQIPPKKK